MKGGRCKIVVRCAQLQVLEAASSCVLPEKQQHACPAGPTAVADSLGAD
jgi:hypothetical protein